MNLQIISDSDVPCHAWVPSNLQLQNDKQSVNISQSVSSEFTNIKELYEKFVQFPFICTDTRKITPNSLFFCLKGENFDGNLFIHEALDKGARYVIAESRRQKAKKCSFHALKGCPKCGVVDMENRIIVVDNVLKTLQQLARYHRNQLKIPIIGITGTNGKTTTKELVSAILSKKYKTAFTQGNLNNHIGVPLTLLSIKKEYEIAIIEMGANHSGEIEELCQIAQPDYGLITNIGKAHLEGFGTIENIIETKTALYRAANVLFVNAEDEILMQKAEQRMEKTESRKQKAEGAVTPLQFIEGMDAAGEQDSIVYYGQNTNISATLLKMTPYLIINLFNKPILTHLAGHYNLSNILAAAAIGHFFGVPEDDICDAISEYTPQNHRSQIIKSGTNTIIADYYNANPTSMKAALDNFLHIEAEHKLAILGDMLELGENSLLEHQTIIDFCKENNIETIFIGSIFHSLKNNHFQFFTNVEEYNIYLETLKSLSNIEGVPKGQGSLYKDNFILIKGSRGIHLEQVML